jgi:hypothetical protein
MHVVYSMCYIRYPCPPHSAKTQTVSFGPSFLYGHAALSPCKKTQHAKKTENNLALLAKAKIICKYRSAWVRSVDGIYWKKPTLFSLSSSPSPPMSAGIGKLGMGMQATHRK